MKNEKILCFFLLLTDGRGSYLSVNGRTEWKTKRIAGKHAADIRYLIEKGRNVFNAVDCRVEEV